MGRMRHDAIDFGTPLERVRERYAPLVLRLFDGLVERLRARYGKGLLAVKLVGSRARGDAKEGSDYDVLVFLEHCDYDVEVPALKELGEALRDEEGTPPLSLSPLSPGQFLGLDQKYEGITGRFRRDAVNLWP